MYSIVPSISLPIYYKLGETTSIKRVIVLERLLAVISIQYKEGKSHPISPGYSSTFKKVQHPYTNILKGVSKKKNSTN